MNDGRAEAIAHGLIYRGAAALDPVQDEPPARRTRPRHLNLALGHGQSPIIGCVGRQLV